MTVVCRSKSTGKALRAALVLAVMGTTTVDSRAQATAAAAVESPAPRAAGAIADYVIGPADTLSIVYWRERDLSADVSVRPDGKISLPLLNDIQAAGLTPSELRDHLIQQSRKFVEDPAVTVIVKEMNSRRVFITGEVTRPGSYALTGPTTVLQLIAMSGGLRDYADSKHIVILRGENGRQMSFPFNYKDVSSRKSLQQNIELKPGDTVIVP